MNKLRENPRAYGFGLEDIREIAEVLTEEHGYEFEESSRDFADEVLCTLSDAGLAVVSAVRGRVSIAARTLSSGWAIVPGEMVSLLEGRVPRAAEEEIYFQGDELRRPLVAL